MLLRLYRSFLRLFPAPYRSTFGQEMTGVFRQREADVRTKGVFARYAFFIREFTSLISAAIRERARHSEAREPQLAASPAGGTYDDVPGFYTCEPYFPRRSAVLHGNYQIEIARPRLLRVKDRSLGGVVRVAVVIAQYVEARRTRLLVDSDLVERVHLITIDSALAGVWPA